MASQVSTTIEGQIRIGDLASLTGVTVEALRYYERRGLLHPAGRRASGYREYATETVRLVRFIKRAQGLGFTLAEVAELVRLRDGAWSGDAPRKLRDAADAKVADIDGRMRELGALKRVLAELVDACDESCRVNGAARGNPLPCPLVEAFDTEDAPERAGARPTTTKRRNMS
ncbi:MAG: MerR family transcriptional regulator [Gemmatimonadaceae bacterium]